MLGAWKASLSIVQLLALACGKRGSSDDSTPYTLLSSPLASYLCLVFLRRHFSPPSPLWHSLGHLLAVSNRPHLWMAPQFLQSNFQPLCLLGDPHTFTGYVWLWQGLSVILTPFRLPQINCFTFSLKCFSSEQNSCLDIGIGPLLQLPHLLRADPVTLALLFSPLPPLSYRVLCGSIYSFPLARDSCPFSAGVLQALLCLKVYSWCIHGERCTPCPPTAPPSYSLHHKVLTVVQEKQDAVFWKDPFGDRTQNDPEYWRLLWDKPGALVNSTWAR